MSGRRLGVGGLIDRGRPLAFTFEGRALGGFAGDTLASALLANGVSVLARSFKYHRPRGLMAAGAEEPNALVQLGVGARAEPNLAATQIELYEGLTARPVNCWPSAGFDIGAAADLIGRFIPAGFYYKTFMWPGWRWFEPFIRAAAGLGRASSARDPDRYEARYAHCDLLIIGAGPAGLAAALAASAAGKRVMLVEQDSRLGGSLVWKRAKIDGQSGLDWIAAASAKLEEAPETMVLTRTTAVGYFDHDSLTLIERVTDHLGPAAPPQRPRQRLWMVRAVRVVLATGAIERPLVFPGNDKPGILLASAVEQYLGRWAVLPGETAVVFTDNDSAYGAAHAFLDAGGKVAALVDSRPSPPPPLSEALRARGVDILPGAVVVGAHGRPALAAVDVKDRQGRVRRIDADLLGMSGGWNPTAHLFSQSGGTLAWDEAIAAFRPGVSAQAEVSVGAAAGVFALDAAVTQAWRATAAPCSAPPKVEDTAGPWSIEPLWRVQAPGKAFVDFQNDVTAADIELSAREAFVSVEHLKRYTTLGMAPDQGKTSNVNALAIMAELTDRTVAQAGTTRFRFPYTAVSFGALGGRMRDELFRPMRRLPTHDRQQEAGAVLEEYGGWLRPAYYPRPGESLEDARRREALGVRQAVGLFEGSPLGKIEVCGPDAGEFLDRIYANQMSSLKVGQIRYGLMLNELGVVIDDGVATRLAKDRFLVGTTSAGADRIAAWLEEWLQCEWTGLEVLTAPLTTASAVLTLSGPKSRAVLDAVGVDFPVGPAEFPHMTFRAGKVADIPARVSRVSFTGEVSFEVGVPADRAGELWDAMLAAGAPYGLVSVGVEAWMLLRTEKGYLHVGADTDGATLPGDVGFGQVLKRKHDFLGRRSLTLSGNLRPDRPQLVGLRVIGDVAALPVGAHLRRPSARGASEGFVTSAGFSPILGRGVSLGMVRGGRGRHGEELEVASADGRGRRVRIAPPGEYDRPGDRLHG